MSKCRTWWMAWVPALVLVLMWPVITQAAARLIPPPGWEQSSGAAPDAQRRAGRWKDALGLTLTQVASPRAHGRFVETAALFERSQPVMQEVMADESRAVTELGQVVANVVGTAAPELAELRTIGSGEQVIWAQWHVDDVAYECVLAPSGDTSTVLIVAVRASELPEQRRSIDQMIDQLEDVSDPMPKFSLPYWRIGAVLVWLALGLALHAGMLRLVDHDHDHATAGRRASLINLACVLLGSLVAYLVLGQRQLALTHAGSSVSGMTEWILVTGLIVVGAHYLLSSRMDRGVVQSAPSSGAFASGVYSRSDVIRIGSGVRPIPRDLGRELSSHSGSWVRNKPAAEPEPSPADSATSGRIYIDKSELE